MDHRFVAQTMCDLTNEELWLPRRDWALQRRPGVELTLRVGTGKRTAVLHRPTGPLTLVYGTKMVEAKCDPARMAQWRTSKEIVERGYFDGDLTLLNSLAHTVTHEFAHVVVVVMGLREANKSHSPEFYRILDKAHANGHADTIRTRLNEACLRRGIDLSSVKGVIPQTIGSGLQVSDFRVGQQVFFRGTEKGHNPLRVVKKNRTKIVVRTAANKLLLAPTTMVYTSA